MTVLKAVSICVALAAIPLVAACSPAPAEKLPGLQHRERYGESGRWYRHVTLSARPKRDGLTYNWSLSAGTITTGQGTPAIVVADPTAGESVTASVAVSGLDASCKDTVLSSSAQMP